MVHSPVLAPAAFASLTTPYVLLDCRVGANARAEYAAGHLEGAHFVDLEADLAAKADSPEHGGRHPLPEASAFAAWLTSLGIGPESHVVAYDSQGGANAAARLWWMLRALGHARVQVLDGGLQAAVAAGLKLTRAEVKPSPAPSPYPKSAYGLPLADIEEVDQARRDSTRMVLDVRSGVRFRGESEPFDPVAGHIPGAHNLPFGDNLEAGRFKSAQALRSLYEDLLGPVKTDALIVHCGSGVTACHTLLALELSGLHGAKLYVGSWSEWCRQTSRPKLP